jgi:hypothetical protein
VYLPKMAPDGALSWTEEIMDSAPAAFSSGPTVCRLGLVQGCAGQQREKVKSILHELYKPLLHFVSWAGCTSTGKMSMGDIL